MCQMCTPADTDLEHDFTVSNLQPNIQRYAFVYVNTVHLRGGMHTMGKVEGWRILRNEGILVIMQGFLY